MLGPEVLAQEQGVVMVASSRPMRAAPAVARVGAEDLVHAHMGVVVMERLRGKPGAGRDVHVVIFGRRRCRVRDAAGGEARRRRRRRGAVQRAQRQAWLRDRPVESGGRMRAVEGCARRVFGAVAAGRGVTASNKADVREEANAMLGDRRA